MDSFFFAAITLLALLVLFALAWSGRLRIHLGRSQQPLSAQVSAEKGGENQNSLIRHEILLQMVLESSLHGIMVTDSAGRVVLRNAMLLQLLDLPDHALQETDTDWKETLSRRMKEPQRILGYIEQIQNHPFGETLDMIERNDGRLLECRTRYQYHSALNSGFRTWAFMDCTEQQRRERELTHIGMHDTLTGIYNRAFFEMKLRQLRMVNLYPVCMFMVDVDGLKTVNDRQGHPAGDQLLRQAAIILRQACRAEDIVARLGGDEFGLLLIHADREVAEQVSDRVQGLLNIYNIRHEDMPVTLSIGYAIAYDAKEMQTLFSRADETMYEARRVRRAGQAVNPG